MIDSSIYGRIQQPQAPDLLAQYAGLAQIQNAQNQNRLADLAYSEKQREVAGDNVLASLLARGLKPEEVATGLASAGYGKRSLDYTKQNQDALKAKSELDAKNIETAHKRTDLMGSALGYVKDNPTIENATRAVQYLVENGVLAADKAQSTLAQFQADPSPQGIAAFATQGYQAALSAKDQLPKYETRNTGGNTDTISINPVTGKVSVVSSVKNTQSPDSVASNATARRGQDMVDQRSREATSAAVSKPFEITGEDGKPVLVQQDKQGNIRPVQGYSPKQGASKPLTDTQAKALQFGSRMQAAEDIFTSLAANGTTTSVPGARTGYGVGATINVLQSGQNQQLDQAKRDFINAVLRRESGAAISPSEFENAEKQYFPQVGDSDATKKQKKSNRELATRGILAEVPDAETRVKKIRGDQAKSESPSIDSLLEKYK